MPVMCVSTGRQCYAEICNAGGWPCEKVDLTPLKFTAPAVDDEPPPFEIPTDES